jgi:hypothetical protein
MKKTVKMTCILKSGGTITETVKFKKSDTRILRAIEDIRKSIENYIGQVGQGAGVITFGRTTLALSEIAAISFKD